MSRFRSIAGDAYVTYQLIIKLSKEVDLSNLVYGVWRFSHDMLISLFYEGNIY